MTRQTMSDDQFEEYFEQGGDTTAFMVGDVRQPGKSADETRRVNFTMPAWLVDELDADAKHLATSRQSIINMRLANYYEEKRAKAV